ncbi:MAG: cation:dicarboxylase symporter family transporter [Oleispira sp.]|nr:cation:dicarboxylase symporter family transporter [Oleispira sp.]MBL4882687.1 cation:dicarboxylase symporter family transporter [Oleispira sp.]
MSFTKQILLGLFLGLGIGIFLGEFSTPFSTVGNIYIGLLQMTVLPYIVVSLIANLGRVSWSKSRKLLISAVTILALLLILGMGMLIVIPYAFPDWQSGSFFRATMIEPAKAFDLVAMYIPANPFNSLANNIVPAVVLFSILLGVGVSGVTGNGGFLQSLDVVEAALNRINKMVIKLTPIGVFAIAAGTAGTISVDELSRLQAYLITYTVIATVLSFLVLPLLVSAVTPFSYKDLVSIPKDTLIMVFATAKIIVLMPQLVENVKELFRRYDLEDDNVKSGAEVLMPLAYPFPNLGTYAILMFVPFSAWYMGRSLDFSDQVVFQAASLLSSFVAPIIGIPFLLDLMRIPADMMELFMMSTVYTDRIRVVLGAVHLLSLTIVVLAINKGVFRWNIKALLKAIAISALAIALSLLAVRAYLGEAMNGAQNGAESLVQMRWMDKTVDVQVYKESLPAANEITDSEDRITTIMQRGTLRVGYLSDSLPFAFANEQGEVTGFDIEMAHMLARDLGVSLELVRIKTESISELFDTGQLDIVMSGLGITAKRALQWEFSASPMDLTLAVLVEDHRRREFLTLQDLKNNPDLRLGIVGADTAYKHLLENAIGNVNLISVSSPRAFLKGNEPHLDGIIYSAEGGSAWTLLYPSYTVVVPEPGAIQLSMAYPLPKGDVVWKRFVSQWVGIKQKEGTINSLFDHWIQGKGAEDTSPRWSVMRNVLHWVD